MKKTSGLGFAIWINSIFFVLFLALAGFAVWAVLNQSDAPQITKLQAISVLLLVTFVPAVIFLNNAILFGKIAKQNSKLSQPKPLDGLKQYGEID